MNKQLVRSATGKKIVPGQDLKLFDGKVVRVIDTFPITGHVSVFFQDAKEPRKVHAFVIGCHFKAFR